MATTRTSKQIPQSQHNEDRMRGANSWYEQSKKVSSDDEKFILLWIAFNAAYGAELRTEKKKESDKFKNFLKDIEQIDQENTLEKIIHNDYSISIQNLLENKYAFQAFWDSVREDPTGMKWKRKFEEKRQEWRKAWKKQVNVVLEETFIRLYTVRNQLIHGGATFESGWGRTQIKEGSLIMAALVPAILKIMQIDIDNDPASEIWGQITYPRINESEQFSGRKPA